MDPLDWLRLYFAHRDLFDRTRALARLWLRLGAMCAEEADWYRSLSSRAAEQALLASREWARAFEQIKAEEDAAMAARQDEADWDAIWDGVLRRLEEERAAP